MTIYHSNRINCHILFFDG
ncbi:MAG: hypothetical protein F9K14_02060 [Candidatus Methanoperedens sp.]|nr:MAG: hypothetical protein F9K14_02060 [Candidatus Methanoperedens sp.]